MGERTCLVCDGTGQLWHGDKEPDTGAPITSTCTVCDGYGELDDEICDECDGYEIVSDGDGFYDCPTCIRTCAICSADDEVMS